MLVVASKQSNAYRIKHIGVDYDSILPKMEENANVKRKTNDYRANAKNPT